MNRNDTIMNLAEAMGINVKRDDYKSQYDSSTGTYYCKNERKTDQSALLRLA